MDLRRIMKRILIVQGWKEGNGLERKEGSMRGETGRRRTGRDKMGTERIERNSIGNDGTGRDATGGGGG